MNPRDFTEFIELLILYIRGYIQNFPPEINSSHIMRKNKKRF